MKLLIVLPYDEYIRNYVNTGAFRDLERLHECHYVVTDRCKRGDEVRALPRFAGTVRISKWADKAHYELFNVLTWRHRKRSRTFHYRFSRFYKTYPDRGPLNRLRNFKGRVEASKYVLLGNRFVGKLSIPWLTGRIPVNADLSRIVREVGPDVTLFPCSAYDAIGNDIARLGKSCGFKTLFLVDNWDNLSSKSIFWAPPDYLGVWGEQSREHAEKIHGIERKRVALLGTPRFQAYYEIVKEQTASPYPFPYILFCGAALAFNELEALRLLDQELDANREIYGDSKIVYRPHPYRQERLCPDRFRPEDFRHVVLDRQVAATYYQRGFPPPMALDYYPALLAGASAVVCPLTTMLVEALICRTPVLAIIYDDEIHYTSPHNAYKFYLHFEGLERMVGLRLNRERDRLGRDLRALISSPPTLRREEVDRSLEYFLHRDSRTYSQRLAAALDQIGSGGAL